jgi:multiple sugar transport system ATP-binding protein
MARVKLENIAKRFGRITAVSNFTLDINDGEFIILVGPSGCGKSTTLRMVAGLETITEGKIFIGDRLVNNLQPKNRKLAMVFQNYALYPHKNVYDNMAFGLRLRRHPKEEIDKRVKEAAKILGIEEMLRRRPDKLSGGQRQRVALGRAIVRKPDVFLLDEPLSNLDAKLRVHMRMELIRLHKRLATTMIYVTHDQTEAMTMGDRIVIMKDGIIQQVGTPNEVFNQPANLFVAGFIGSPAMNYIECEIINENSKFYFQAPGLKLKIPAENVGACQKYSDRKIVVGIRPEYLYDSRRFHATIDENTVQANVEVIEPLGSEIIVYLKIGDSSIVGRLPADLELKTDQHIDVAIDMSKLHCFDPQTSECFCSFCEL